MRNLCGAITDKTTCTSLLSVVIGQPFLATIRARNGFVKALEVIRSRHKFLLIGYVVMPEHVHLLISEPKVGNPSKALQALKQKVSRALRGKRKTCVAQLRLPFRSAVAAPAFWQRRFYDFNVWSTKKLKENSIICTPSMSWNNSAAQTCRQTQTKVKVHPRTLNPEWCGTRPYSCALWVNRATGSIVCATRRREFLATKRAKDVFVGELARVRREYGFRLVGYVVMPNHIHLLVSEPGKRNVSTVLQMLKQRVARKLRKRKRPDGQMSFAFEGESRQPRAFWQARCL